MKQTPRKKPKEKPCKVCLTPFLQYDSLVVWCSPHCGYELAKLRTEQSYAKETKRLKREYRANDKVHHKFAAQKSFNAFVRERDEGCISCGTFNGKMNAGHFLSIGSNPGLRFHPFNNNKQCERCNSFKSGNQANYRIHLVEKIGLKNVEFLEGPHESQNLQLQDFKDINIWYKEQINEIN